MAGASLPDAVVSGTWESSVEPSDEISGELSVAVTSGGSGVVVSSEVIGLMVSSVTSLISVPSVFSDDSSGEPLLSVARVEPASLPVTGSKPQLLQIAAVLNIIIRTRMQIPV